MAAEENIDDLKSRLIELEEENKALAKVAGTKEPLVVPGKLTVEWATPEGKKAKRTVRFRAGRTRTPLADGALVSSAALMRIANGGKPTDEELQRYPELEGVTKEIAVDRITHLAQIGATVLEDSK